MAINIFEINKKDIGIRIKSLRTANSFSIKGISEVTGISAGNISEIENGHVFPSAVALANFSSIFHCSIDYILLGHNADEEAKNTIVPNNSQEAQLLSFFKKMSDKDKYEVITLSKIKVQGRI